MNTSIKNVLIKKISHYSILGRMQPLPDKRHPIQFQSSVKQSKDSKDDVIVLGMIIRLSFISSVADSYTCVI